MDPISLIVMALVTGAAAALKPTTEQAIKDAYAGIKGLIQRKYGNVNVPMLESDPASKSRQDVIKEDLEKTNAKQDEELLHHAQTLLDVVQQHAPDVPRSVGIDLKDIKAATSLNIGKLLAEGNATKKSIGPTAGERQMPAAVQIENSTVGGDLRIKKIQYIGQQTTQIFYDKAGVDWNKRLTLVSDLRPESFKLGDTDAAQFPYIITPIEDTYNRAVQILYEASDEAHRAKHGILVLGESNAGKTRLVLETLSATLPSWSVFRWRPDYTKDDIPPVEFLSGKRIVLFIDDLQDYTVAQTRDTTSQFLIADPHTMILRTLVETLLQAALRAIIVSTCRTENQLQAQAALGWLFVQLMEVSVPDFSVNAQDAKAAQIIAEFQKRGPIHIEDWDGTLGSLVLGLSTKNSQYLALPLSTAKVLRAMKLLSLANTTMHTERRLRAVCANVFAEKRLLHDEQIWQEAVRPLIDIQFVKEELDESSWETVLTIRKDTYFEQVVTDYPQLHRPHQLDRDLMQLRNVLMELKDVQALLRLSLCFMFSITSSPNLFKEIIPALNCILTLEPNNAEAWLYMGLAFFGAPSQFEQAVEALDHALTLDPNNATAWRLKRASLLALNRHEEAVVALDHQLSLDPNNAGTWYDKGLFLTTLQRYEEAVEAFDHALTLNPNYAEAWSRKAASLILLGQNEEAVEAFDRALTFDPNDALVWNLKGDALCNLKRYEEAVVALDHALTLDPDNAGAWSHKGNSFYFLGQYEEAVEAFDHLLTLDPSNAAAWGQKGASLGSLERYEEAVAAIDHLLTLDPSNAAAWGQKGLSLYNLERYEEAVAALDHALTLDPSNAAAWGVKGASLGSLERYEEAVATFDHLLTLDPNNAVAWGVKGVSLNHLERYEEAIAALDHALTLDPTNTEAWGQKGASLGSLERYEEAVATFDHLLTLDPNNAAAWGQKGLSLYNLERYEEAVAALDYALTLDPTNTEAWGVKGASLGSLERYEEAVAAFDHLLTLDPNNAAAWNNKGVSLYNLEQYEEAVAALDHALTLDPSNVDAWGLKGACFIHLEQYEEAVVALDHLLTLDPSNVDAWNNKGASLGSLERYEEAVVAIDHLLTLDPSNAAAWEQKGLSLYNLERYEEAVAAFDHLLTLDPNNAAAWGVKIDALRALGQEKEARSAEKQAKELYG